MAILGHKLRPFSSIRVVGHIGFSIISWSGLHIYYTNIRHSLVYGFSLFPLEKMYALFFAVCRLKIITKVLPGTNQYVFLKAEAFIENSPVGVDQPHPRRRTALISFKK